MFDSLSMLTASNSGGSRQGLRQALRFRKRRLRRTPQSPSLLPPFKSSDTICTATGAELGNSATSFGPQDTWNKDICPYATFQVPGDSQQPSTSQQTTQQSLPQVTIKLQHHAQLDDNNLNTYRPAATAGFVCSTENPFVSNTTDTFKIKPSTNVSAKKLVFGTLFTTFSNFSEASKNVSRGVSSPYSYEYGAITEKNNDFAVTFSCS